MGGIPTADLTTASAATREPISRAALEAYRAAYTVTVGEGGRRSWAVNPAKLAFAHDLAERALVA
jgi:hypothetical protein